MTPDSDLNQNASSPEQEELSKTELKRQMTALQKLGEELVSLTPAQLGKLPLPENLESAIYAAKKMTKHRALYRQRQYIGKLMRDIDAEPIRTALDELRHPERQANVRFHLVESWRDRLQSAEGDSTTEFIDTYPGVDRQQFMQKVRAARQEQTTGKPAGASRALFRFIDAELAAHSPSGATPEDADKP